MVFNGPAWASDVLVFGIVALLVGLALVIVANMLRTRAERRE